MRSVLKALLYALLLAACYWCGFSAYRDYALLMMEEGDGLTRSVRLKSARSTNAGPATATNQAAATLTNQPPVKPSAAAAAITTPGEDGEETATVRTNRRVGRNYFRLLGYTVGFAAAMLVLGFVAAQDFGHLLKFRLGREVSYVDARSERNAQYERAEHLALKGSAHDAIKLLQAIIAKHPNHVHSVLRIAELYDKELHDFPNAALHYEEVLKLKIPDEQWGWVAIRLANIYSGKLGQPQVALDLIRRLAAERPGTQAGAKALKRLAKIASAGLDPEAHGDV
ncbi:MAG: hypothetical protein FD161_3479 [Limisphaerales bacterium]|nr:MAG: hypothetical protein FD161_3479 [Limisphaerales bacterium]KAG0507697.1 MAG: hypothetical protein E1N63_3145 [Limisphaerales bacterium]TXT52431.1 MAG: hypothetical protein FD140_655 [Limisphaerales bacterium]